MKAMRWPMIRLSALSIKIQKIERDEERKRKLDCTASSRSQRTQRTGAPRL